MKRLLALGLLALTALAAPLREIVVEGADPVLQALARAALPFGVGDEPQDLEAARRAILETGYFRDVRLALEGDVLKIVLVPNPPIAAVRVETEAFPEERLLTFLEQNFAIGKGATYNPVRAQEAAEALARAYRQAGFPFTPKVAVEAKEDKEGIALTFRVEERPEVKAVRLLGVSLLPEEELRKGLEALKGSFDFAKYQEALRAIAKRYEEAGYRFSGPDPEASTLEEGVLTVRVRELKVARVEGEGLPLEGFPLKPKDPLNYQKLLEGIQDLSRKLSRVVNFTLLPQGDEVVVRLELGPEGGRIERVEVSGNTALPAEALLGLLRLKPGEVYTPALAQEDAARVAERYREEGYEVADVRYSFQDGVYRLEVVELKIGGYRLEWQGGHRTRDEVVLRELPKPGSLLNVQELRKAIARLMATGLLAEPPRVSLAPGEKPDEAVVVLGLKEARTGLFQPAIGWSSLEGWSGSLAFKETNLFGLAHQVSLDLAFIQNDARDNLSFSAAYTVPWLYLDYLDLKEVRTSLAFSLYSTPIGNTKLLDGTTDTGWEYTERRTGASLSLSRPLSRDLSNLRTSLGLSPGAPPTSWRSTTPTPPATPPARTQAPPATPQAPAPTRTPPTCAPSSRTPAGPSAWTPPWPTWTWTTPGSAPRGTRRASPPASASPCPTQAGGASSSPWWPRARPTCPWTRKSARPSPSASPRGPSWATRRKASASTSPEAAPRPSSSGATRTGSTGASPSPPRAWSTATTSASPPKGAPTSTASSSPTLASPTTPGG